MLTKFLIPESVFCNFFEFRNQHFLVPTDISDNIPLDLNMAVKKNQQKATAVFWKSFVSEAFFVQNSHLG